MKSDTKDVIRWLVYAILLAITALTAINHSYWPFLIILIWVISDFIYISYLHFHKLHRK